MGVKLGSLTLKEEFRLRMSENRVLRGIFRSKREEIAGRWKDCIMSSFTTCVLHYILLG
jgi:hypothetical protein